MECWWPGESIHNYYIRSTISASPNEEERGSLKPSISWASRTSARRTDRELRHKARHTIGKRAKMAEIKLQFRLRSGRSVHFEPRFGSDPGRPARAAHNPELKFEAHRLKRCPECA